MRAEMILVALMTIAATEAVALESYECNVKEGMSLSEDGSLQKKGGFADIAVGTKFTVDRRTGRVLGKISNHNAYGQPKVIDPGSSEQSFKAITIYQPNVTVDLLIIQQFSDSPEKPFIFLFYNTSVLSGTCTET